jgi:uncharacterized membrane protein
MMEVRSASEKWVFTTKNSTMENVKHTCHFALSSYFGLFSLESSMMMMMMMIIIIIIIILMAYVLGIIQLQRLKLFLQRKILSSGV